MKHDVPRLDRALASLRAGGFQAYRAFMGLAGDSWADRRIASDDVATVMAMADRGFDAYGQRAWVVLFADGDDGTPGEAARERIADAYGDQLQGREHKFLALEICNERANGDKLSVDETRRLTERLQARTRVPVIPSAAATPDDLQALYTSARLANIHHDRFTGSPDGGRWEPNWEPFEMPWAACSAQTHISGEPIGPQSSVNEDRDPLRLVMGFVVAHLVGAAGYFFHPGAGIRGGGAWDTTDISGSPRRLPEHLDDHPEWAPVIAGFAAARRYLPDGVNNWHRWNGHWSDNPIDFVRKDLPGTIANGPFDDGRLFKAITAVQGPQLLAAMLRLRADIPIAARQPMDLELIDPLTGRVEGGASLKVGDAFTVQQRPPSGWQWDGDGWVLRATLR